MQIRTSLESADETVSSNTLMISAVSGALLLLQSLVLAAQLESDDRCGLTTGGQARF